MPEPKRDKKTGNVPGPALYSPRYEAVEGKRDKSVQNWLLALKATPVKSITPNNTSIDNQILSVISKEVKMPKQRVTQEDIDREDDQLISTLIERLSPKRGEAVNAFQPRG